MIKNSKLRIIGLTGQSGAGKSTVSDVFRSHDVVAINADSLAHIALKTDKCKDNLRHFFGDEIFDENGEVVRKRLARAAFCSEENTQKLNMATHPVIAELAEQEFQKHAKAGEKLLVFDAPTLLESGLDSLCTEVVSVIADKDVRAHRIMKRDNLSFEDAMLRLNAQHSDNFYTDRSSYVIENNGSKEELLRKAEELYEEILNG